MNQGQNHEEDRGAYDDQMAAAHMHHSASALHFAHHSSNSMGQSPFDGPPAHPGETGGVGTLGPCSGGHHQVSSQGQFGIFYAWVQLQVLQLN